jgi:hypothetical protein
MSLLVPAGGGMLLSLSVVVGGQVTLYPSSTFSYLSPSISGLAVGPDSATSELLPSSTALPTTGFWEDGTAAVVHVYGSNFGPNSTSLSVFCTDGVCYCIFSLQSRGWEPSSNLLRSRSLPA